MAPRRFRKSPTPWVLGRLRTRREQDRVSCEIGGRDITFSSGDTSLRSASEAFAGPMLLPAMKRGVRLEVASEVDATWDGGTRKLCRVFADWWGYEATYPVHALGAVRDDTPPASGHALCFTGGVDSFASLLDASSRHDHLLYMHGLDIPLSDRARWDASARSLRAVASETGRRMVFIATDIREHPLFASVAWERSHGAVLAAAGHLLGERIGRLSIPPSWQASRLQPWGSHPDTDVLWSSQRVRIEHESVRLGRCDRLRSIAHNPLVWRHLQVCWEHLLPTGNCSRCEKCLRTMTALAGMGVLDRFEVFDQDEPLEVRLAALASVSPHVLPLWAEVEALDLKPSLRRAVAHLMVRSRPR